MKNIDRYMHGFSDIYAEDFTIFAVDDVLANIMLINMMLVRAGFKVEKSTDPTKVLELAKQNPPDLFLLDVMMPQLNGWELAKLIKEEPELSEIPVIFLTAFEDKESMMKGFAVGASDYLTKPFEQDILLARIRSQLKIVASKNVIKQQNEELKDIIYGRDKMYSVIAHDLRSPLGTIKMSLKALEDIMRDMGTDEMLTELVVESGKQVSELFNLLDNLLKWTKSMTGTLKVVYQDFEASTIITGVMDMYKSVAAQKGITLTSLNSHNVNPIVHADADMCSTVLRNLVSNAVKFTSEGKNIYIDLNVGEDCAIISVRDEGCGMSEEEQSRLFNKDTHFTKYGTAREEGSGLGLLLCKNFAEMNGGKLTLESVVGQGSVFSMYIPLSK